MAMRLKLVAVPAFYDETDLGQYLPCRSCSVIDHAFRPASSTACAKGPSALR